MLLCFLSSYLQLDQVCSCVDQCHLHSFVLILLEKMVIILYFSMCLTQCVCGRGEVGGGGGSN